MRNAIIAWLAFLALLVLSTRCAAQHSDADVLTCARAVVGEIGWSHPEAWVAMTAVHVRRAERMGTTLGRACFLYSSAIRRPRRRWVPHLHTGPRPPRFWPEHIPWARHRARFALVVEIIRLHLAGLWPDPCGADHYGGPATVDPQPAGWILLRCADAPRRRNQRFYKLP